MTLHSTGSLINPAPGDPQRLVAEDMKRPCENNILINPEGWAGKAVGTLWRYRIMQGLTLFGGVCLFLIFVLAGRCGYMDCFGVAVLISAFVIGFPLDVSEGTEVPIYEDNFKATQKALHRIADKSGFRTTPREI